jgi:hypothetical protein
MRLCWLEPSHYLLRLAEVEDGVTPKDRPPYHLTGSIVRLDDERCIMGGFSSARPMTKGDVTLIYRTLAEAGFKIALAERRGAHTLPFGKLIDDPVFGRWRAVDLTRISRV